MYHGRIVLPPTYPLRPPSFRFLTPSGRFEANREICLSISGHHEETWQPAWGLRTALVALRAFMETDPRGQVGGLDASDAVRRRLAGESGAFVCAACGGRSNAAILAEAAAAEAAGREEGDDHQNGQNGQKTQKPDDEVPAELRLVFRDELVPAGGGGTEHRPAAGTETDGPSPAGPAPVDTLAPSPAPPAPAPAHAVPVPTPTVPLPAPAPLAQAAAAVRPPPRHSDDAVPLWVDRSLVVLCVVLAAMLMRTVFG